MGADAVYRVEGSSPRMRGALHLETSVSLRYRIIPADAGSTLWVALAHPEGGGDHPRGCGEHNLGWIRKAKLVGSSPRMRGALTENKRILEKYRIIPADAGSTRCYRYVLDTFADHPRGCGEHLIPILL